MLQTRCGGVQTDRPAKSLKSLTLYGKCQGLTDQTLPHLAGLTALEELGTDGIQVTDAGLVQLKSLPKLKKLTLQRADISEADLAKLRADLPGVVIEWKPLTEMERKALEGFLKP